MWDLSLNEHESMMVDSVRAFLNQELSMERLRPNGKAVNLEAIEQQAVEMGLFGIGLPESIGGSGLGLVGDILVHRECGRYLASPNFLARSVAAHVAYQHGNAQLAEAFISGEKSVCFALPNSVGASATSETCSVFAFDWRAEQHLLFWNDEGIGVFTPNQISGCASDSCVDNSVALFNGQLALTEPACWLSSDESNAHQKAQVLLSAAMVGLAEHACDLTVEYAKVREQFGKAIGTFQAVKHRCADMGIRSRLAWYQTCIAALKIEANDNDIDIQVASAKLLSAQAVHENGRASIQMHGAIGFQSECDVHWFMKRAHIYDQAGGNKRQLARLLAREPSPYSS